MTTKKRFTRRKFLGLAAGAAATAFLSTTLLGTAASAATGNGTREVITGAHWGAFKAQVKGGKFVKAIPFAKDLFPSKCVEHTPAYVYSPSRIKYPMVRAGFLKDGHKSDTTQRGMGDFVRVSWDKALELVARELNRVRDTHGPAAIYGGSPGWRNLGKYHNCKSALIRMLNLNGGYTASIGDYSTGASQVIMGHVMGNMEVYSPQTAWPSVIEHSDTVVIWGSDPLTTLAMGWAIPDHGGNEGFAALKKSGKKVIVIDPMKTETVEYLNADWIAPRPGSDTALMLGVAHAMLTAGVHDLEFLDEYTVGFDKVESYILGKTDNTPKTPEWAAKKCGIKPAVIRDLAKTITAGRTMLMSGWSMQRADHGEQAHWMLVTLASMVGQIGLPGGGFGLAYHYAGSGAPAAKSASLSGFSAVKPPKNAPHPIPVSRIADALLNPGATIDFNGKKVTFPDIKLIYWAGGNPFHHHQDRNRFIKAWQKPETVIIHEMFWTPTAKYADIVLPACTSFEQNDIEKCGDYSAKFILPMHKVVDPLFESKPTIDIFAGIADKLGHGKAFTEGKSEMEWIEGFYNNALKQAKGKGLSMPDFKTFWESGDYVEFPVPQASKQWVRHGDFREDPLLEPLGTPSGKIELYSKTIEKMGYKDCPPHAVWMEPVEWLGSKKAAQYPLHLLSPHPKERVHSQMNHVASLRKTYTIKDREPVWISATDAKARGIAHGDVVRVFNDRGQVLAGAFVTEKLRPGVVRLKEGGWYDPATPGKENSLCKYGHVNVLTIDKGTSKLAQAPSANSALVQIEKFKGKLPAVTAFDPPNKA